MVKQSEGTKLNSGITQLLSLELYRKGSGIEEIAQQRNLAPATIVGHLLQLAGEGEEVDFRKLMPWARSKEIVVAAEDLGVEIKEKPFIQNLLDHFGDKFQNWELRLALGAEWLKRKNY
jgi:ATP-dependent DNA helicase RecQ